MKSVRALALVLVACACGPTGSTRAPAASGREGAKDGPQPQGPQEGEGVPELKLRLERLLQEQRGLRERASTQPDACHDLCSLSASICEVKVKLCDLADARPGEASYQDLCREAQQSCNDAQESCESCVRHHESAEPDSAPTPADSPGTDPP